MTGRRSALAHGARHGAFADELGGLAGRRRRGVDAAACRLRRRRRTQRQGVRLDGHQPGRAGGDAGSSPRWPSGRRWSCRPTSTGCPSPARRRRPTRRWPGLTIPSSARSREAKERERLHLAYCRGDMQWKERALNKDDSAPRSPYGPCPVDLRQRHHQHQQVDVTRLDRRSRASLRTAVAVRAAYSPCR